MTRFLATPIVATFALSASLAFAGDDKKYDVPNVLVIKVTQGENQRSDQSLDQGNQQGQDQTQQQVDQGQGQLNQSATLIPLTISLRTNADGTVDQDQLIRDAEAAMQQAEEIPLTANMIDDSSTPAAIQQVFQQAQEDTTEERQLAWRWYQPWGRGGYFGYNYYPYWGYSPYYRHSPYFGYYSRGYVYPYNYGFYNPTPFLHSNYYYYWRR